MEAAIAAGKRKSYYVAEENGKVMAEGYIPTMIKTSLTIVEISIK